MSVVLLGFWLSILPLGAATRTAASSSQADVSAAISSAANGDTVLIPAGTSAWSGNISVAKAISIIGAGTNSTIISGGGFDLHPGINALTRLSQIHFRQSNWGPGYLVNFYGDCKMFRIDHCMFTRGNHAISSGFFGRSSNGAFGVIDRNHFHNCNIAIFASQLGVGDVKDGDKSWTWPMVGGTTNTVCIEDNLFTQDSEITDALNNGNQQLYGQNGGRVTFRFNTYLAPLGSVTVIDSHPTTGGYRAQPLFEVYSNYVNVRSAGQFIDLRGGQHLWYGNTFINPVGTFFTLWDEFHMDIVNNSHFWNNTGNGSLITGPLPKNGTYPYTGTMGANYFMTAPQPGQAFYPYTPLAYPHPLVSGVTAGPSTNPVISVTPSSGDYGAVAIGSTNDLTFTVKNIGGGTLAGTVSVAAPLTIVGNSAYALASNATQTITIRYVPTQSGDVSQTATFTGGGGGLVSLVGGTPLTYLWPLGDSNTQGNAVPGGYRLKLYQLLTNAGVGMKFVGNANDNPASGLPYADHDGYGGYEIGDIANNVPTWLSAIHAPDYVLLMIGLNDFRHNNDVTHATNRLENLIVEIAAGAPSAKIIVADMNPWTNLGATNAAMEAYYNPYIPGVVARQAALGRNVYLCDMRGKLSAADMAVDNTHFNQTGYDKIGTNWFGVVSALISPSGQPLPPPNLRVISAGP